MRNSRPTNPSHAEFEYGLIDLDQEGYEPSLFLTPNLRWPIRFNAASYGAPDTAAVTGVSLQIVANHFSECLFGCLAWESCPTSHEKTVLREYEI